MHVVKSHPQHIIIRCYSSQCAKDIGCPLQLALYSCNVKIMGGTPSHKFSFYIAVCVLFEAWVKILDVVHVYGHFRHSTDCDSACPSKYYDNTINDCLCTEHIQPQGQGGAEMECKWEKCCKNYSHSSSESHTFMVSMHTAKY